MKKVQSILKPQETEHLVEYCKQNYISVSAFVRSTLCKELDKLEREKNNGS